MLCMNMMPNASCELRISINQYFPNVTGMY